MDNQDMERDLIEIYDDEDNPILTEVLDYFFYNGEEMEEFIPVDDDDLEGKLLEVATQYLDELNNPETEEE